MSDDIIEYVVSHSGTSRRQFLVRLLAGSAFAAPVIASFAIGGTAAPRRSPLDAAASNMYECASNQVWDEGTNMCVDEGNNQTDDGSDDGDAGSGAGIPPSK